MFKKMQKIFDNQQKYKKFSNTVQIQQSDKKMFSSQSKSSFKLKYFQCKKGQYHEGQVLNYVCIQKSCLNKGLICSVCKSDHGLHNVIPLKYLLNMLKKHQQEPMQSESFQTQLEELQQIKNSFLYDLKEIVEKFSSQIEKIQEEIMETYKQRKVQLLNQIQMNMKFNHIIGETLNNQVCNQEQFERDFKVIASLIQTQNKQGNSKNSQDFKFKINLKHIVQQYQAGYKTFSANLTKFYNDSQLKVQIMQPSKILQTQSQVKISNTNKNSIIYKFSSTLKGGNMTISNENRTAQCMSTGSQRFALIDGIVVKTGSSIRFKIQKLKNWIGLGLAVKNNIVSKNYHFTYNNIGHGSFLISNNNYSWSHAYADNNLKTTTFGFVQGDIIRLDITEKELIYTNQTQANKIYKLPILLTEDEWKQACFCANLCSVGDSASIVV